MSYAITCYFQDAGIALTSISAQGGWASYQKRYGDDTLRVTGLTDSSRFTATPEDGDDFYRWVYRLGDSYDTVRYSYDNPFIYNGNNGDITIRAESYGGGSGGGEENNWHYSSSSMGAISAVTREYAYLGEYEAICVSVRFSKSGTATFYSVGDLDTIGYLSLDTSFDNENGEPVNWIAYNDDGGEGSNFLFEYEVVAGRTYYFWARFYDGSETAQFDVYVAPPGTTPTPGGGGIYIYTNGRWKKATPYVYQNGQWKRAKPAIYQSGWKIMS